MHLLTEPGYHAMENKIIQACFWELAAGHVKSVRHFISTAR